LRMLLTLLARMRIGTRGWRSVRWDGHILAAIDW